MVVALKPFGGDSGGGFGFIKRHKSTKAYADEFHVYFKSDTREAFDYLEVGSEVKFTLFATTTFDNYNRANAWDVVRTGKVIEPDVEPRERVLSGGEKRITGAVALKHSSNEKNYGYIKRHMSTKANTRAFNVYFEGADCTGEGFDSLRKGSVVEFTLVGNHGHIKALDVVATRPGKVIELPREQDRSRDGYSKHIKDLAAKARPENWSNRGEDGVLRPCVCLENYAEMWFKNIVAHQRDADALRFSEDGFWAVFGMRLKTKVKDGHQDIYALFQKEKYQGKQPYSFAGWYTWSDILAMHPRPMLGPQGPKAVPLPDPKSVCPTWWKTFDKDVRLIPNYKHILGDNIERLRETLPSETPLQKRFLLLGKFSNQILPKHEAFLDAVCAFFGRDRVRSAFFTRVCERVLAYAEFASAEVAADALEVSRGKKIGDMSCRFVLSQGPPSEKEVSDYNAQLLRAIANAKELAHDSPLCALPQLFLPGNDINNGFQPQLLLPLHLKKEEYADAALALEFRNDSENPDKDSKLGWFYWATTVLTLPMSLNNARTVQKLETEWLSQALRDPR